MINSRTVKVWLSKEFGSLRQKVKKEMILWTKKIGILSSFCSSWHYGSCTTVIILKIWKFFQMWSHLQHVVNYNGWHLRRCGWAKLLSWGNKWSWVDDKVTRRGRGGPAWLAASRIRITIHYAIKLSMISLTVLEFGLYLTFRF